MSRIAEALGWTELEVGLGLLQPRLTLLPFQHNTYRLQQKHLHNSSPSAQENTISCRCCRFNANDFRKSVSPWRWRHLVRSDTAATGPGNGILVYRNWTKPAALHSKRHRYFSILYRREGPNGDLHTQPAHPARPMFAYRLGGIKDVMRHHFHCFRSRFDSKPTMARRHIYGLGALLRSRLATT